MGAVLALVSHELKNPLNVIQPKAETLLRLKEAQEAPGILKGASAIVRAVGTKARIIDDLLDLSRRRTGKLTFSASQVDLRGITPQVLAA
ncbi:histidine kinase dimerization/phospho-acceptor domain-containing protein [Cupriavidus sp. 8B]